MPQPQPLPTSISHYPQDVLRIAALVRTALGLQKGQQANLRMVMKTGLLAGQEVRFQNKAGKVLNKGATYVLLFLTCSVRLAFLACWSPAPLFLRCSRFSGVSIEGDGICMLFWAWRMGAYSPS